ncbi:unnamed protein product [Gordionus sp. m RMFG-2023]
MYPLLQIQTYLRPLPFGTATACPLPTVQSPVFKNWDAPLIARSVEYHVLNRSFEENPNNIILNGDTGYEWLEAIASFNLDLLMIGEQLNISIALRVGLHRLWRVNRMPTIPCNVSSPGDTTPP